MQSDAQLRLVRAKTAAVSTTWAFAMTFAPALLTGHGRLRLILIVILTILSLPPLGAAPRGFLFSLLVLAFLFLLAFAFVLLAALFLLF